MSDSLLDKVTSSLLDDARPPTDDMKVIYLVRHGRTSLDVEHRSDGYLDFPLSDEGQLELVETQQMLKRVPIQTIFTPDLRRTQETAQILKSGILSDPKIVTENDSKTWNLGIYAGTKKKVSRPAVKQMVENGKTVPPGGEAFNTFCDRFLPWLDRQRKAVLAGKGPVLVVLSGSNLRCIGLKLLGDENTVDMDEGGLAVLHCTKEGYEGETLHGGGDQGEDESA